MGCGDTTPEPKLCFQTVLRGTTTHIEGIPLSQNMLILEIAVTLQSFT